MKTPQWWLLWLLPLLYFPTAQAQYCQDIFIPEIRAGMPQPMTPRTFPVGYRLESFPEHTSARVYAELAVRDRLLVQTARELELLDLLNEKGGLCASSSLTNVVASMVAQEGNFVRLMDLSPRVTQLLVEKYYEVYRLDARLGADVSMMADVMASFLPEILTRFQYDSFQADLNITVTKIQSEFYPYRLFNAMRGDSIAIATVRPLGETAEGHAIVILKVDVEAQKLIISDPNHPNQILAVPFRYTEGTDVVFRVPFTYQDRWVQFLQINSFRRSFHPRF